MDEYNLNKSYLRQIGFSSQGVQNKYYKDGVWYKQNISGYEGKAEKCCSIILANSNIKNYVTYEECMLNGKMGCMSRNFLEEDEAFVTFQRLYNTTYGGDLSNKIYSYGDITDRIKYTVDFIGEAADLDITLYLKNILNLDMLTLNTDRHFHNLGLIKGTTGYREAPIFDNGAAFFSNMSIYPPGDTIEENLTRVAGKPFCGSLELQAAAMGEHNISLDVNKIKQELEPMKEHFIYPVIMYQLDKYQSYFSNGNPVR